MNRVRRVLPLVLAAAVAARGERPRRLEPAEHRFEAPIAAWILHVDARMVDCTLPTCRDLLAAIRPEVPVVLAIGEGVDLAALSDRLGADIQSDPRFRLIDGGSAMSAWARDRYVTFERDDRPFVLLPDASAVAREKAGDLDVARALPGVEVVPSDLDLEGGDLIVTEALVLVGLGTVLANAPRFDDDPEAVVQRLASVFARDIFIVGEEQEDLPHDHLDMFLSVIGPRRVLLGDPRLASGYFAVQYDADAATDEARSMGILARQTQEEWIEAYETLAAQLKAAGFSVERLPILHTDDGVLITWNNVVTERRDGRSIAYVPAYGIPVLDREAHRRWRRAGYEVFPIRAARAIVHGGAVRCLTNVLRRPAESPPCEADDGASFRRGIAAPCPPGGPSPPHGR